MENSQETVEPTPGKYPKLHPLEKILYVVIFPLGFLYLFYCFLLFIGLKPTDKRNRYVFPKPELYDPYKNGYLAPYNKPGTALWNSLNRK